MYPLRAQMIEQLQLHRKAPGTQDLYVKAIYGLTAHYKRSPDQLSPQEIQRYLHHLLTKRQLAWSTCNVVAAAIRFFYVDTLGWTPVELNLPPRPAQKYLPRVLSVEQLECLFTTTLNPKHRALLEELNRRAAELRDRFNERFWLPWGWYALALDGQGQPVDSLTTNPGHALWAGIAEPDHANQYLDRLMEEDVWTGWGLRTLASTMAAYDPLSYHNGSVWPHDTAICAAGAARYGRWDVVDRIVDGALDAATEFNGRPPELFAGIARSDAPTPVAYPSSCSPQAWASASVLLLVRAMLDLHPDGEHGLRVGRAALHGVRDVRLEGLWCARHRISVDIRDGQATIVTH